MTRTTTITEYPEIGVEMREYSFYDGRGEGAADCGAEVFTLNGVKVDTSNAVSPASWIMERRIKAEKEQLRAEAIENLRREVAKYEAAPQSPKIRKELEKMKASLVRLQA